jgi:hypothetical protein
MPKPRIRSIGFAAVGLGVGLYGLWALWVSTRTERPVDIPISMVIGHVHSPDFTINVEEPFTIRIEVEKRIPFDTLNCLLGTAMGQNTTALQECPDRPSVVKASWVLTSNGRTVAKGSSEDYRSGEWRNDAISRGLGYFQSQRGHRYALDVSVLADGSSLAPGNPRLKVEVSPAFYERNIVLNLLLLVLTGSVVLVGVILLAVSLFKGGRKQFSQPTPD